MTGNDRPTVRLTVLPGRYAVCRLPPDHAVTMPADAGPLYSLTHTSAELSIVCEERLAPTAATVEPGWAALVVAGPLDFALTGILSAIAEPLATAGLSIFAVSTYDTDYVLLRADDLESAVATLQAAGHIVES